MKTSVPFFRRAGKIAGIFLLLLGGVLLIGDSLLPQVYFAKVTMEVKPDNSGPIINIFGGNSHSAPDPQFLTTQFQILRSPEILNQVIDNLKLTEAWSSDGPQINRQAAFWRLSGAMKLRHIRKEGLIESGVYSADAQEAANIANTIAVVYQQKLLAELQRRIDRELAQLTDEVEKQRVRAEEALAEATAIKERDGIVDLDPDGMGLSGASSQTNADLRPYLDAKARALEAKRVYEAARIKFATEMLERGIDFDPAKIWEKAEPPAKPTRLCFYRLRYAFARYSPR